MCGINLDTHVVLLYTYFCTLYMLLWLWIFHKGVLFFDSFFEHRSPCGCFIVQILKPDASLAPFSPSYWPLTWIRPLFVLAGNCTRSCARVSWMWPSPASSPWTATTPRRPRPPPPLRTPPPRPPPSPPTPAPLPSWGRRPFTWALSPDCKHTHTNGLLASSPPCSDLAPKGCSTCHKTKRCILLPCVCCLIGALSWELTSVEGGHKRTRKFCQGTGRPMDQNDRRPLCHFTRLQFYFTPPPPQADSRSPRGCGAAPTETVVPYVFSNASLPRLPVSLLSVLFPVLVL